MAIPIYYVINFLPKPRVGSQVVLWLYLVMTRVESGWRPRRKRGIGEEAGVGGSEKLTEVNLSVKCPWRLMGLNT